MSEFTTTDFTESIHGEGIKKGDIEKVIAGWGNVDRDGACCEACGGEWSGGFLLAMKDGRFAYISGWCDYTGWGCQDGTNIEWFDTQPALKDLEPHPEDKWDVDPSDLNLCLPKDDGEIHV